MEKALREPAGPAYLDALNLVLDAQPEVNTHVTVRNVTGTTAYLRDLLPRRRPHQNARSDTAAVRARSNRSDIDPMVCISSLIHQKIGQPISVHNYGGNSAVVPQISYCQTSGRRD